MTLISPNWPQERKIFRVRLVGTVLFIVVEFLGLLQMNAVVFGVLATLSLTLLALNVWGMKRLWPPLPTLNLFADQILTVALLAASGGVAGPLIFLSYLHLFSGVVFFGVASTVIPIGLVQVLNLVLSGTIIALMGGQPHPAALSIHALAIMTIASFFAEPAAVLHAAARRDELTGVLNRRSGLEELAHWLELGTPFSLLFADLNAFKRINDTHGHLAGDEVLKHVSTSLLKSVRGDDLVVRYGGDEFLIATHGDAAPVVARLQKTFARPLPTSAGALQVGVDFGVAHFPEDADKLERLVEVADEAMFRAKRRPEKTAH